MTAPPRDMRHPDKVREVLRKLLREREGFPEIPELYEIAKEISHRHGHDWTDPRTGKKHPAPKNDNRKP